MVNVDPLEWHCSYSHLFNQLPDVFFAFPKPAEAKHGRRHELFPRCAPCELTSAWALIRSRPSVNSRRRLLTAWRSPRSAPGLLHILLARLARKIISFRRRLHGHLGESFSGGNCLGGFELHCACSLPFLERFSFFESAHFTCPYLSKKADRPI